MRPRSWNGGHGAQATHEKARLDVQGVTDEISSSTDAETEERRKASMLMNHLFAMAG